MNERDEIAPIFLIFGHVHRKRPAKSLIESLNKSVCLRVTTGRDLAHLRYKLREKVGSSIRKQNPYLNNHLESYTFHHMRLHGKELASISKVKASVPNVTSA